MLKMVSLSRKKSVVVVDSIVEKLDPMMDIENKVYSALVITTNHPKRFSVLKKTLSSLEGTPFVQKVLSVDEFVNIETDKVFFKEIEKNGWEIYFGKGGRRNGMAINICRGLSKIKSEWVLYCEDDVTFKKIPPFSTIETLNEKNNLGFISCAGQIYEGKIDENIGNSITQYLVNKNNYTWSDGFVFLKKDHKIFQKKWFLNFPSCIIKRNILKELLGEALVLFKGNKEVSIEEGLSNVWYNKYVNLDTYICLVNYPSWKDVNMQHIHDLACLNYWSNDASTRIESVNNKASMWF